MNDRPITPRFLIGLALHELASDTENLLHVAVALEDKAVGVANTAQPETLRQVSALVRSAALQLCMAAANVVGTAERLRILADLEDLDGLDDDTGGELPS